MSLQLIVFVPRGTAVPPATRWAKVAAESGIPLSFAGRFDPARDSGSRPVTCGDLEAAFEYYNDDIGAYLEEVGGDFSWWRRFRLRRGFGRAVGFVTHSRSDDRLAACAAAASLAAACNGLLLDCESGRFMAPADAVAWGKQQVRALTPANVTGRGAVAREVHQFMDGALRALGFAPAPLEPPGEWSFRAGTEPPTQLVEVRTAFDGEEGFLLVTFFGTPHSLDDLRRRGLEGNVAGINLMDFFYSRLDRDVDSILPKNIPVGPGFASSPTARQLMAELQEADRLIWAVLAREWEEASDDE